MLSYNSFYIPGYTGFIPNLESIIGETYGNATRKLLARQAKLLRLSHTAADTPEHRNLLRQPCGLHHTQWAGGRNTAYEYPPMNTNHHLFTRRPLYDCDPSTASAVQTTERAKADLKSPPKPNKTRQLTLTKPGDKTVMISSSATPGLPSDQKILGTTIPESVSVQKAEGEQTSTPRKRNAIQKSLGKPIYRADRGLPPSYTGYIPGHKFSFGKTWGVSTRNSLEAGKRRPFVWTSHM
ncbi:protein FAM166B-like [Podarcis raffonei]|uniref:protein FAM166B-like n=1 Tax=Podarcis raffonei TaxID=65483 RepID=UPI002329880E|nr:protein FAM166B-like [Podarcis raffonei]